MLPSFFNHSVTRVRPGTKTERGSAVPDWTTASSLVISGCHVQPSSTGLSQDGRVLGISEGLNCYLPPDADVAAGDRIICDGETYTINGAPKRWRSASGGMDNIQLSLQRWQG